MTNLKMPFIRMPKEFVSLLKSNLPDNTNSTPIVSALKPNKTICHVLTIALKEFDDGRGIEKLVTALGWAHFRDRLASIFVYKTIHGHFPTTTNMELVEDIKNLESKFGDYVLHGTSRLFLLGFYVKLANLQLRNSEASSIMEISIPADLLNVLRISPIRSEKIDWLILIVLHLVNALGEKVLISLLIQGKKMDEIYELLPVEARTEMHNNLLSYSASINEPDFFLYEKV
jgi:hypothetical protein